MSANAIAEYLKATGFQLRLAIKQNKIQNIKRCVVHGMHEPIISESDFNIVQSLLQRDTMKANRKQGSYIFQD